MINIVLDYDKDSCFRFDLYLNEITAFIILVWSILTAFLLVATRLQQYSKNNFMS